VAYEPLVTERQLGAWRGKVWMAPDFDEVDDEITRTFEEGQ
jgi:hypothetical protein